MTKTKKFAFDMVTATVRIDPGLLLSAVSTVRLLENSLTEPDIDQATRREGLLGMILVFQSLTFTRTLSCMAYAAMSRAMSWKVGDNRA